jgi:phosphatidylinositol alpha-mannosyltransferase
MFQFAGGVQEIVLQLQKHLELKGHSVKIITPRPRAHFDKAPKNMILIGRSAKMNTPFSTMVDFGFEADGDEIADILERENFDVIHYHEPWVPLLSRQILTRSNAINVATFHATPPETVVSKSLLSAVTPYTKSVLAYLHAYTAVSDSAAEYVKSLTKEPINIVPNGIDIGYFKYSSKKPTHKIKTILYLGRLEKRKGVRYLIDAYSKLRETHDDVKLVIAGSGVKRKSLERYCDSYEIPNINFIGFVEEKDKVKLMAEADLYCSPAPFGESFGIVLLEAMAVGTPVVAGNNPGYASVMTGLGRISLVTPKVTDDFSQRLELMLYNEDVRQIWRDWAKGHLDQFSFSKVTDAYEEVYMQALKVYA